MLPDICINNYIFDLEKTIIMKERILKGWSLKRILLVVFGLYIIYQSVTDKSWADVAIGTYFISMGVFAFGCAFIMVGIKSIVIKMVIKCFIKILFMVKKYFRIC